MYNYADINWDALRDVLGGVLIIYLVIMVLASIFGLLSYILTAIGTYTMASRRGIKNAWLAWIPVGNIWILGAISDNYQYVTKRKHTIRGVIIVILAVTTAIMVGISAAFSVIGLLAQSMGDPNAVATAAMNGEIVSLLTSVIVTACTVVQYFCLYDLFASSKPENAVLYLVLSLLVSVTMPFLIFACRHYDLGMQPKRPAQRPSVYDQWGSNL